MNECRSGRGPGDRIFKAPRFDFDLSVSGPHIGDLDDGTELGLIKPPARAHSTVHPSSVQIHHARKTQTPLRKRIRGGPNNLVGLRSVTVRISGDHLTRVWEIVAIAPCDAADPAPIDVIRVSRSGLAGFDFCPQGGLGASLRPASAWVQYKKTLALISISVWPIAPSTPAALKSARIAGLDGGIVFGRTHIGICAEGEPAACHPIDECPVPIA